MSYVGGVLNYLKKNQTTIRGVILSVCLAFMGSAAVYIKKQHIRVDMNQTTIANNKNAIKYLNQKTDDRKEDIQHLRQNGAIISALVAHQVTRESFNSYIKRKDDEYHIQQQVNINIESNLGSIRGQLTEIASSLHQLSAILLGRRR